LRLFGRFSCGLSIEGRKESLQIEPGNPSNKETLKENVPKSGLRRRCAEKGNPRRGASLNTEKGKLPEFEKYTMRSGMDGVQHTLQALSQGFREMIRSKKWAQKAHARRERRRAARQKEVGHPAPDRRLDPSGN
jgi:hypothetical protein